MIPSINRTFFQEIYFSNSPVKHLQIQLSKIRAKIKNKPYSTSINIDKDILKFNREMEKFFGYNTYSLNISSDSALNAYAWPVGIYMTKEEKKRLITSLQASSSGFRHNPKNGSISAICTLNMGLVNCDTITDEEIFAILLHEVGHTFFEAVTDKDCIFTINSRLIDALKTLNKKILSRLTSGEKIDSTQIVDDVNSVSVFFTKAVNIIKPSSISKFITSIKSKFFKESMEDNMVNSRIRYTNEKFADTFTASYGYAVPLHSALMKMTDDAYKNIGIKQSRNSIIIFFNVLNYLYNDLWYYILNIKDEHPDGLTRIKVSCEYLKKEIAREGIDPKLKLQLVAQLDELNKLIDDYINFPKDQDNIAAIRAYYTLLYRRYGGDRREQDTDNDALFDTMDNRYKEIMKK